MSDKRTLMAMMTAKGVMLSTGLSGGVIIISPQDVAASLGMGGDRKLHKKAYIMGRVKYCDDMFARSDLRKIVTIEMRRLIKDEVPEGVIDVLMNEGVWRPIHEADKCKGRGCLYCSGTGLQPISVRERARMAGDSTGNVSKEMVEQGGVYADEDGLLG